MKRFLVFGYDIYYPAGGLDDLRGAYDTLEEATLNLCNYHVVEIVDTHTGLKKTRYTSMQTGETSWGADEDLSAPLGIVKTG